MIVTEERLGEILEWLKDNAKSASEARAHRVYLEDFIPALRAKLAAKFMATGDSAAAADMKAKASDEYMEALEGYRVAVEKDEWLRWKKTQADALVEIYRTQAADRRTINKVT